MLAGSSHLPALVTPLEQTLYKYFAKWKKKTFTSSSHFVRRFLIKIILNCNHVPLSPYIKLFYISHVTVLRSKLLIWTASYFLHRAIFSILIFILTAIALQFLASQRLLNILIKCEKYIPLFHWTHALIESTYRKDIGTVIH